MPLSDAQRQHLKPRLLEERTRAVELLGRSLDESTAADTQDRAGDLKLAPFHPADVGTDTMDDELEMANASRVARGLEEIDAALARLSKTPAQFGRCGDSGRDGAPFPAHSPHRSRARDR